MVSNLKQHRISVVYEVLAIKSSVQAEQKAMMRTINSPSVTHARLEKKRDYCQSDFY